MGIYQRMRRSALAAVCACGVVTGVGLAAGPGSAFAVECEKIAGSGSSLQAAQQSKWIEKKGKFVGCTPSEEPVITYLSTSSGAGLEEFGMEKGNKVLKPREGHLDAFVGTDDPPNKATLLQAKEATTEGAESTKAITVPTVAAPVSVIIHPPAECVPTAAEFKLTNEVLDKLWIGFYANWKTFLTAAVGAGGFEEKTAKACENAVIKHEVRSDSSGTSFAFKQYLSQIDATEWNSVGKEFVTDEPTWPVGTGKITEHEEGGKKVPNKGSGGEAKAVGLEAGSVGYVNLANAAEGEFIKYAAKGTKFWARIRNAGAAGDPEGTGKVGNCPEAVTLTAKQKEEAKGEGAEGVNGPNWSTVHLASTGTAGFYPICTLTYDVGWEAYTVKKLEAAEEYNKKGTAVENTSELYFIFMTGSGQAVGKIANYYSKLPEGIVAVAKEDAKKV